MRPKFSKCNPEEIAAKDEAREQTIHGKSHTLLSCDTLKWEAGKTYPLRLLPQPETGSPDWPVSRTIPYVYVPQSIPGLSGSIPLTAEQLRTLTTVNKLLYGRFRNKMYTRDNTNGISLREKYRELFFGFVYGENKLEAIMLPANGFTAGQATRIQAGTRIKQLCYQKKSNGEPKYGDIFDIDNGWLLAVTVTGSGRNRSYEVEVEDRLPLSESKWDDILCEIPVFDSVINFVPDETILRYIKGSITSEMWCAVVESLGLEESADLRNAPTLPDPKAVKPNDEPKLGASAPKVG